METRPQHVITDSDQGQELSHAFLTLITGTEQMPGHHCGSIRQRKLAPAAAAGCAMAPLSRSFIPEQRKAQL